VQVVQGLDLAVPLMDEGEIAEVEIHPRFGYGNIGKEPDVPPSAVLMYTIELLKSEPEPEFEEMSIEKRGQFGLV
jgi:FK506-binding protein 8